MKNKMTTWLLAASIALPAALTWAEPTTVEKVEGKYNEMKADSNRKDIRKDNAKLSAIDQKRDYWKGVSDSSLKQYHKALKAYGPSSDLTKDAKDRHELAMKEFQDAREDRYDAKGDLRKDQRELNDAKRGEIIKK